MGEAATATREDPPLLSLVDVHKVYRVGSPVTVLDGVSLVVEEGSYTAVMGPSGSGKSTLLNLMGCLDTPTAGDVVLRGRSVAGLGDAELAAIRRTEVGFVFQTFDLMPRLSALENVELPMVFADRPREERRTRARSLLESVGLGEHVQHAPSELSGGQRQRVGIARALANEPAILLADEPTGSLDSGTGGEILELFGRLHADGHTLVVVTHERHVAEHAQRIVRVFDGNVEAVERPDDEPEEARWTP